METSFESIIAEIAQNVFWTMVNIELIPDGAPLLSGNEQLLASVQIAGEWLGCAVLALSPQLARAASTAMLGISESQVNEDDQREVAAELVNMIGGNIKSTLPGPSFLSLPTVFTASDYELHVHHALMIEELNFRCAEGALRVRLYAKTPEFD